MTGAFLIETEGHTAGIAVRAGRARRETRNTVQRRAVR
jgi:hypothetical protein